MASKISIPLSVMNVLSWADLLPDRIDKTCETCKAHWDAIPKRARWADNGDELDGYYWECEGCGSTMFVQEQREQ